jgi:hypothetical protein
MLVLPSSTTLALVTFAALALGITLGTTLRRRLPEHHLREESREVLQTASGILATLVALVMGLLVSSAKGAFDQAGAEITGAGATAIVLDRALAEYGPEAAPIRADLRRVVAAILGRLWPDQAAEDVARLPAEDAAADAANRPTGLDDLQHRIRRLDPPDDLRKAVRDHAVEKCEDLIDTRWLMVEQSQNPLPPVFLVILVAWLAVLATGLGLLAPRNATTVLALVVCAASMSGAIFLIMELNRPFQGTIQVSPSPLQNALRVLGR